MLRKNSGVFNFQIVGVVLGVLLFFALVADYFAMRSEIKTLKTTLVTATQQLRESRTAAQLCSQSVLDFEQASKIKLNKAAPALAAAKRSAKAATAKAQAIMMQAPTQPGNDCASAKDRAVRWLAQRGESHD